MPFSINPDLIENDDVRITTNADGDFVLEHVKTGNTIKLDNSGQTHLDSLSTVCLDNKHCLL